MKIVTRIKGGIGNQLFCYAAARRLAISNRAELVIDDVSGFARDYQYRRQYALDRFRIPIRKATSAERMEPFERYRRGLLRLLSRSRPFEKRWYLEQEGLDFDDRLLSLQVNGTTYLDGYWQSEDYFKDVEKTIRKDLQIIPPMDDSNQKMAKEILNSNSVALHVRWFDAPNSGGTHNMSLEYYNLAISHMEKKMKTPRYFLFSDQPEVARKRLDLSSGRITLVNNNHGDQSAYADLWLMTQCRHFIIANSTFSWWGAWLGLNEDKIIICPGMKLTDGTKTAWNFSGQIPNRWLKI